MSSIDLNADLGEGFGNYRVDGDLAVMPLITSANVACGFHAGDPRTMEAAVTAAKEHRVQLGAHPGYPDKVGFGRRPMTLSPNEISTDVVYQLGALNAFCRRHGIALRHVKPHGALGNLSWRDDAVAEAIVTAVASVDPELIVLALSDSALDRQARSAGLRVAREAFLDRAYRPDGTLMPRGEQGAVLHDVDEVLRRARRLVADGTVVAVDGTVLEVSPDSLCLHGDTAGAPALLDRVGAAVRDDGVELRAFGELEATR